MFKEPRTPATPNIQRQKVNLCCLEDLKAPSKQVRSIFDTESNGKLENLSQHAYLHKTDEVTGEGEIGEIRLIDSASKPS